MRCSICGKTVDMSKDGTQLYGGSGNPDETLCIRVAHAACADRKKTIRLGGLASLLSGFKADNRRTEKLQPPAVRKSTKKTRPRRQVVISKKDLDRHSRGISQVYSEFTNRRRR